MMVKGEIFTMHTLHVGEHSRDGMNVFSDSHVTPEERMLMLEQLEYAETEERLREKKSPYKKWYQFNKEHSKEMIWLATNHPKAQGILLFLLEHMDGYNAVICSHQVLSEALAISTKTVARAIKVLKECGFIAVLKSGTGNVYVVNNNLAWSSWGTNYKYCQFPANVVLSAGENKEFLEQVKTTQIKQVMIEE